eukprot:TRINITY_DN9809_c0_g1_i2.p1 TRINITY_DN9809_c0_g1~~TRINITY_DN9809_c0_g1_i2.p1  ORF type:complete len:233 (+),score=32.63 TRINITY_DN9809_c0_g1_i2:65-700(+)
MHTHTHTHTYTQPQVQNAGMFTYFFGENGNAEITYPQFTEFLHKLKDGLLAMEFERYASHENPNVMTARNFGMAVVSYAHPADVPHFLDRVNSLTVNQGQITFAEFKAFSHALEKVEEIALAIQLYATGGSVNKPDFARAVDVISGVKLTQTQLDIIFHVFDRNGDGKLDANEVMSVMKKRANRGLSHHRDTGFNRRLVCAWECLTRTTAD